MELKLFGRKVFEFSKSPSGSLTLSARDSISKSEFLPDFLTMRENQSLGSEFVSITQVTSTAAAPVKKEDKPAKAKITPKGVYKMGMLNNMEFKMKTDPAYLDQQIATFKDKLDLIKLSQFDMSRGVNEIASILTRLENRRVYGKHAEFYSGYAITSVSNVNKLLKDEDHLKLGKVEQFLADMPKEAIDEMKKYTKATMAVCGKKPIFYIIADKKDFEKSDKRRDPILLAQSPFGHFWQILGAWDSEMLFLEEL